MKLPICVARVWGEMGVPKLRRYVTQWLRASSASLRPSAARPDTAIPIWRSIVKTRRFDPSTSIFEMRIFSRATTTPSEHFTPMDVLCFHDRWHHLGHDERKRIRSEQEKANPPAVFDSFLSIFNLKDSALRRKCCGAVVVLCRIVFV